MAINISLGYSKTEVIQLLLLKFALDCRGRMEEMGLHYRIFHMNTSLYENNYFKKNKKKERKKPVYPVSC